MLAGPIETCMAALEELVPDINIRGQAQIAQVSNPI